MFLKERSGRRVTVSGAVRNPGLFPIEPETTLLQAIALAEGLDPLADDRSIVVFRPSRSLGARAAEGAGKRLPYIQCNSLPTRH